MTLSPSLCLQDQYVSLEPMTLAHSQSLYEAGQELSIWKWTTYNYCGSLKVTRDWVETCLQNKEAGTQHLFEP